MRWQDSTSLFDEAVGEIYGLNPAERHCLSFLWGGPQTPGAIAREIRLTPAAVTALLDRMEARGYVRRENDPDDRRRVLVTVTAKTNALTAETYGPVGQRGAEMLATFSDTELATFIKVLESSITVQQEMTDRLLARKRRE
jgi:DNA-binding MarR family transcriptional regulator